MWGALLGIGASLLGSLFSRPAPQPAPPPPPPPPPPAPPPQIVVVEKQTNTVDMKKLVTDSREAGFNPLTVMRNGGMAGYTTTDVPFLTTNPLYVDWEQKANHTKEMYNHSAQVQQIAWQNDNAQRQWFGGLISSVGQSISGFTGIQQQNRKAELELDLLSSEIFKNDQYSRSLMFQPNVVSASTKQKATSFGETLGYEQKQGQQTAIFPWGLKPFEWLPDTQTIEDGWGEIPAGVYGPVKMGADIANTSVYYRNMYPVNPMTMHMVAEERMSKWFKDNWNDKTPRQVQYDIMGNPY